VVVAVVVEGQEKQAPAAAAARQGTEQMGQAAEVAAPAVVRVVAKGEPAS
jgi:hypothetical protein